MRRSVLALVLALGGLAAVLAAMFLLADSGDPPERDDRAAGPAVETTPAPEATGGANVRPVGAGEKTPVAAPATPDDERETVDADASGAWENALVGHVYDPDGSPVEGARIELLQGGGGGAFGRLVSLARDAETDGSLAGVTTSLSDGSYAIRSVEPRTPFVLRATHADFPPRELPSVQVKRKGETIVDVDFEAGWAIHGTVRSADGAPIAGAEVTLDDNLLGAVPGAPPSPLRRTATTDDRGAYVLEDLPRGTYALIASAEGFGSRMRRNVTLVSPEERESVQDFQLEPGCAIAGVVYRPDRTPLAGATIHAIGHDQMSGSRETAVSGADGTFELADLASGKYMLIAYAKGYDEERLRTVDCGTTDLTITMAEQGTVLGTVVDGASGAAVPDFLARLRRAQQHNDKLGHVYREIEVADSGDGAYEIGGVEPGFYVVEVETDGYALGRSEKVQVSQGLVTEEVRVELGSGGSLRGRVVAADGRKPLEGATVRTHDNQWSVNPMVAALGIEAPRMTTAATTRTDADGYFELSGLIEGTYQVQVDADGFAEYRERDISVEDGRTRELGEVLVRRGATLRGVVEDAEGSPRAGVRLTLSDLTRRDVLSETTDAKGRYAFENLPEGRYEISAGRSAGAENPFDAIKDMQATRQVVSVTSGAETVVDLTLAPDG